ncbi:MAG TPA: histidine kinase [Anaerolineaceae bacterium]
MAEQAAVLSRPGPVDRTAAIAMYLIIAGNVGRTLARLSSVQARTPQTVAVVGLELVFCALFTLVLFRREVGRAWLSPYFIVQSALIIAISALAPALDFVNALFLLLCYQAAVRLTGLALRAWTVLFVLLTGGVAMLFNGLLKGLGLGLVAMAAEIVLVAYMLTRRELEVANARSQAALEELSETNQRLTQYAGQVEELAAIEERNRLARELHDSVSQTMFSILLNTRAAELLLERNPAQVRAQLEQLQELAQSALAGMRSLIAQLRLKT